MSFSAPVAYHQPLRQIIPTNMYQNLSFLNLLILVVPPHRPLASGPNIPHKSVLKYICLNHLILVVRHKKMFIKNLYVEIQTNSLLIHTT